MTTKAPAIYLDYAATTPVDRRVLAPMLDCLSETGAFGNPASNHPKGREALAMVEKARADVASLVGALPREIVWTSGATEADNLALLGAAMAYESRGRHIITVKIEHKAVLDTCEALAKRGFEISYLTPDEQGLVSVEQLIAALRPETLLVSMMHVNNETGVIQDIAALGAVVKAHGALFHVDAAQSAGKLPINLAQLPVDYMSFSAHKLYGPKGIGALYVRQKPRRRLVAQMHGGGHERGMRSGTLPTQQIVGMGACFALAAQEMAADIPRITGLREQLWRGIRHLPGIQLNGHLEQRVAGILNVSFAYVEGEALLTALEDLSISSGSACTSTAIAPSYVLSAMGQSNVLAHNALRLSLGRFTTEQEIDYAIGRITTEVERLLVLSPLWDLVQQGVDLGEYAWRNR